MASCGRDRLLDGLALRGDETVLDVGCGRGLLLIGAAKRLTTETAVGVDIRQTEDLSGNRPEAMLENARLAGVAERVEVKDGDAHRLPFADGAFDEIVTKQGRLAIGVDRAGSEQAGSCLQRLIQKVVLNNLAWGRGERCGRTGKLASC